MNGKDYYRILGVDKKATPKEVKGAYRRLARKYHPDVNPGDKQAEEKFKDLSEAYAVLGDPERRKQYEAFGSGWQSAPPGGGFQSVNFDLGDVGFGDLFDSLFGRVGGRAAQQRGKERGNDITYDLEVTVPESVLGATKSLKLTIQDPCPQCEGSGSQVQPCPACGGSGRQRGGAMFSLGLCLQCRGSGEILSGVCPQCSGKGFQPRNRSIEVKIPAGVGEDSKVRIAGEGQAGVGGGKRGDLMLKIHIKENGVFKRQGQDVLTELTVPFPDAILGAEVSVPTVSGKAKVKVPPGTQSGQTLRLRGLGAPSLNGKAKGDQLVQIKIAVPTNLDEEGQKLVEKVRGLYK
jgi:molecular chaperone DnaJ